MPNPLTDDINTTRSSARPRYLALTTINGGDQDLVALGGSPSRALIFVGDGTLVLIPEKGIVQGASETGAVLSGLELPIRATVLKAGCSGFTGVWVLW